jgi:hypothetical protein
MYLCLDSVYKEENTQVFILNNIKLNNMKH